MKIFNLPRAAGKSMRMVYASEFNNAPILCANISAKEHIKDMAKTYGVNIPEPIAVSELDKYRGEYHGIVNILVDETLLVLTNLLGRRFNIIGCTLSDEKK